MIKKPQVDHSIFRLVIRNIEGYDTFPAPVSGVKREHHVCPELDKLKQQVLQCLIQKQSSRKARLVNWSIAWQTHAASGLPHLDLLLVYQRNVNANYTTFDYLIKKLNINQRDVGDDVGVGHVWVTPYSSKKLNKAILQYGQKEDPCVISNISLQTKDDLTRLHKLKADSYKFLYDQMKKNPLHFNLQQYVQQNQLSQHISSWSSIKSKLKDMQFAAANLALKSKPGFKYITRQLIQSRLSPQQLLTYDSWSGYQTIVNYLNQIVIYGCNRPFKSKQLLLVGKPNTGKTSLVRQLQKYCAAYHMDVSNWFPRYQNGVYSFIFWDQFKLKGGMSHTDLLKFLQGSPMDLQYKGGSTLRNQNQMIIMTSNMTIKQHLKLKFKELEQRKLAYENLTVRVEQVQLLRDRTLFLLLKLIMPAY